MKVSIVSLGRLGQRLYRAFDELGYQVFGTYHSTPKNYLNEIQYDFLNDEIPTSINECDLLVFNLTPSSIVSLEKFKKFLSKLKTQKIIFISSTSVYGNQGEVDEDTLPSPMTKSGELLLACEEELLNYSFNSTVIRPSGIYSEISHPGKYLSARTIETHKDAKVNLIDINEIVAIVLSVYKNDYKVINATNGNHPNKIQYYTKFCLNKSLVPPKFIENNSKELKTINTKFEEFKIRTKLP